MTFKEQAHSTVTVFLGVQSIVAPYVSYYLNEKKELQTGIQYIHGVEPI